MEHFQRPIETLCLAVLLVAGPCFAAPDTRREELAEKFHSVVVGVDVTEASTPEPPASAATSWLSKLDSKRVLGSGILVSADGLVLTTSSLFDKVGTIEIRTEAGATYAGKLVLLDQKSRLALVKVQTSVVWPFVPMTKPVTPISVGERVVAFGMMPSLDSSLRPAFAMSEGVVTALERPNSATETNLESSVYMFKGSFGGGPLVRLGSGEVIGINSIWRAQRGTLESTVASAIEKYLKLELDLRAEHRPLSQ